MKKRLLSLLLAIVMVVGLCPLTAFAASTTTYMTVKDDVPVWSSYSSSSTKKYTIADQGTLVYVTGWKINSSLNTWYQLSDGNWVYSGNVEKHTSHDYTGGICNDCGYEYPYTTTSMSSTTYIVTNTSGASIWSRPYSNNSTKKSTASYGSTLTIVGKTTNEDGNLWYKTSSGTWVYSGNVAAHTSHSYSGGICKDCGYEWPYTTTSMTSTTYVVTNTSGASIWSRPYSNNSTLKSTASYGSTLTIVGKTTNQAGNLWYKTSSGTWVYSGNVEQQASASEHVHKGVMCSLPETNYEPKNETYHNVLTVTNDLCSCGAIVDTHSELVGTEAHSFDNGVCTLCGYKQEVVIAGFEQETFEPTLDIDVVTTLDTVYVPSYQDEEQLLAQGAEIQKYLSKNDTEDLFGCYNFALYFVSDLSLIDGYLYCLQQWKLGLLSFAAGNSTQDMAEYFLENSEKLQNVLAETVDSMCDDKTVDVISDDGEKILDAISVIAELNGYGDDTELVSFLITAIEDLDITSQAMQEYSDDVIVLNNAQQVFSSNSVLGQTTSSLLKSYQYQFASGLAKVLTEKIEDGAIALIDLAGFTVGVVDTVLQFVLSNIESLDAINDTMYVTGMRTDAIYAFTDCADIIRSGNYTAQDVLNYKTAFDFSKHLTIVQYEAMRSYYDSDSLKYNFLNNQIKSLESMSYDAFTVAGSLSEYGSRGF